CRSGDRVDAAAAARTLRGARAQCGRRRARITEHEPRSRCPMKQTETLRAEKPQPAAGELRYQSGFGSELASEALPGALPQGQNSPQRAPYGLYPEQLSGTAFTAPRAQNRRSWLYRIRPAVMHRPFRPLPEGRLRTAPITEVPPPPNQLRWDPFPLPDAPTDFVDGLFTLAANGDAGAQAGMGVHIYAANRSMQDRFFYDADGE